MVKVSIKTLKGDMFQVDAEDMDTVLVLKEKISSGRSDFEVDRQKLIHAGKVLKDTSLIVELGIADSDFIVCMITARRKAPTQPSSAVDTTSTFSTPVSQPITQSVPQAPLPASIPAATSSTNAFETPEAVESLVAMGFPEAESRAALRASQGNPDVAVEFLMNGIPESAMPTHNNPSQTAPAVSATGGLAQLDEFRRHPNFTQLQRLVQENPAELNRVLGVIGAQNPALLAAIHENHEAFITMMNEPISEQPAAALSNPAPMGNPMGGVNGAQLMQMMASLPPAQRSMMAQQMGMTPEILNGMMQMVATLPPEQLQQMMQSMPQMGGMGAAGGVTGAGGMPGAAGGMPTGSHVVRLTEDEMAAVNRLMELGFSQQQAAQAFLAW
jgi:UV excision repair protein RAD23